MNQVERIDELYKGINSQQSVSYELISQWGKRTYESWPAIRDVLKAALVADSCMTVSMDLTRGPGSQKVFELDEIYVKDLERAIKALNTDPKHQGEET